MQRNNFTISVAKLKKSFKAPYLLSLLRQNDNFTTGLEPAGKGVQAFKHVMKGTKESKLPNPAAADPINEQNRRGLCILKR